MSKEFVGEDVCTMKVEVYTNREGNIVEEGDAVSGTKNFTFHGFASSITSAEAINTEDSPALHNGVSGLVWLLSGTDENFDEMIKKTSVEVMEDV